MTDKGSVTWIVFMKPGHTMVLINKDISLHMGRTLTESALIFTVPAVQVFLQRGETQ